LELIAVLILLADFGQNNLNNENYLFNADHIEHKINLLLILFDLRGNGKINIVEVMMMIQTVIFAASKVFPKAKFF
jgi:hypothetical protein